MGDTLLIGLMEIAGALRCSVRKLHNPRIKRDLIEQKVIFERRGNFGQKVWAAYQSDLMDWQKRRAARGEPF